MLDLEVGVGSRSGGRVSAMYQKRMYCEDADMGANCVQMGSVTNLDAE